MRRSRSRRPRVSADAAASPAARGGIGRGVRNSLRAMTVFGIWKDYSGGMREGPMQELSIILERVPLESRWATHRWELAGVVPDQGGEPRVIVESPSLLQKMYPGFEVGLYRDEAEGYFLNVSSEVPSVFVSLRTDDSDADPYPFQATLSYNEAARWMDSSERVERVPVWRELAAWVSAGVEENYRPEPKKG